MNINLISLFHYWILFSKLPLSNNLLGKCLPPYNIWPLIVSQNTWCWLTFLFALKRYLLLLPFSFIVSICKLSPHDSTFSTCLTCFVQPCNSPGELGFHLWTLNCILNSTLFSSSQCFLFFIYFSSLQFFKLSENKHFFFLILA